MGIYNIAALNENITKGEINYTVVIKEYLFDVFTFFFVLYYGDN